MRSRRKGGFTLIELMVVVIIVGILASVAVPIYRANIKKAMATEGAALLGSVLTGEKVYYAEHNTYTDDQILIGVTTEGNKYFPSYTVSAFGDEGFTAATEGTGGADGITVTMEYTNLAGATISYDGL
ncbi:MAG: prepilin-type N-terminal cleavage/methylation domain-containing protein [Candidatus Ratteibacteria bacterium]|jgi:prepilin-type N-terminal cleavage/methylation domain-containing protein